MSRSVGGREVENLERRVENLPTLLQMALEQSHMVVFYLSF